MDLGVNLYTHHYHRVCENRNLGIYLVQSDLVLGFNRNSACKNSFNIGYNVYDRDNLTLTLGALTGYPNQCFKPYVIPSYKYRNLRISVLGKEGVHFSLEFNGPFNLR